MNFFLFDYKNIKISKYGVKDNIIRLKQLF